VFIGGSFIGGCDIVREMHASGELARLVAAAPAAR
jgi:glutaredoxin-related protein